MNKKMDSIQLYFNERRRANIDYFDQLTHNVVC